jgi:WD40 repeat protein
MTYNVLKCNCMLCLLFFAGGYNHTVKPWDVRSNKTGMPVLLNILYLHSAFSITSAGSYDHTLKLWDVRSGKSSMSYHATKRDLILCLLVSLQAAMTTRSSCGRCAPARPA